MSELIFETDRKARKTHTCSYCGGEITAGTTYRHAVLKYDDVYVWKSHKECNHIASELWDYIDPDEGMTEDEFQEGCRDFARAFICPECPMKSDCEGDCLHDNFIDVVAKIYNILSANTLQRAKDKSGRWSYAFELVAKEGNA